MSLLIFTFGILIAPLVAAGPVERAPDVAQSAGQCARDMAKVDAVIACAVSNPDPEITAICRKNWDLAFKQNAPFDQLTRPDFDRYAKRPTESEQKTLEPKMINLTVPGVALWAGNYAVDPIAAAAISRVAISVGGASFETGLKIGVLGGGAASWVVAGVLKSGILDRTVCNHMTLDAVSSMAVICSGDAIRPEHLKILTMDYAARKQFLQNSDHPMGRPTPVGSARNEACKSFHDIATAYTGFYNTKVTCDRDAKSLKIADDAVLRFSQNESGQPVISRDLVKASNPKDEFDPQGQDTMNLAVPKFHLSYKKFYDQGMLNPKGPTPMSKDSDSPFRGDQVLWMMRPKLLEVAKSCGIFNDSRPSVTTQVLQPVNSTH